jgi:hypothetical protein
MSIVSFSCSTTKKELQKKMLEITETQALAELEWQGMKANKALEKSQFLATLAKYSLSNLVK